MTTGQISDLQPTPSQLVNAMLFHPHHALAICHKKAASNDHMSTAQILAIVCLLSLTSEDVNKPNVYSFKAIVVPTPGKPDVLYTSIDFVPALQTLVTGTASPCKDNETCALFQ